MNQLQPAAPITAPAASETSQPDREMQLAAYNAAFAELGLRFRWDMQMFDWLCGIECEKTSVARYIEDFHAHLLKAYEASFLSELIFDKKSEYMRAMAGAGVN